MARKAGRGSADCERTLKSLRSNCPACGQRMWADYDNYRTVVTLQKTIRLTLKIRRCHHAGCVRYLQPYRPEAEGGYALPQHEFGLDVIALVRDLPRTNNDLEQLFGSYRWHERRITGRKTASPAFGGRGSVRLPAAIATPR